MGERGAAGGSWGARGEAAWWPGAGELQHQQQINEEIARSTAAPTHQLYTYKMTGSFSNSGVENTNSNFDYRMISGSNTREEPQQQNWWYSSGSVESHQSSSPTGQNQSSPEREQGGQDIQQQQQQQQLQQTQTLQQQLQQQNLQQVLQNQSLQQSLQQSQQQTLQQMLQQQQLEQQQQQQQQQQEQQQQNLQNQQQQVLQNLQQTLQVSQSQAQAIVQAQAALQQQVAQSLQHQQQTLQDHIQAIQQQQIQAALQRQSATLQELQQQQQQQQQSVVVPSVGKGSRMPRARAFNKPRGRMTAYAFFLQTCREEHRKKHPDENVIFATFSKKCAERWNTMSEKEKARFHAMAEEDKKRYDMEMLNYVPPKDVKIGRGRKRHQIKDPNAPKRSLSAFFWFCNDERSKVKANNPEYTMGDIAKELGRRWAAADPTHKAKYEALSEQDKARYDREMTAYKKGPQALVHQQLQMHQQHQQQIQQLDDVGDDDNAEYE